MEEAIGGRKKDYRDDTRKGFSKRGGGKKNSLKEGSVLTWISGGRWRLQSARSEKGAKESGLPIRDRGD